MLRKPIVGTSIEESFWFSRFVGSGLAGIAGRVLLTIEAKYGQITTTKW
jgi:hypothetical protein